jgi:hypothetical protein
MNHPITPPPERVQQWHDECHKVREPFLLHIATQAARWGADQQLKLDAEQIAQAYQDGADMELDACCEWLVHNYNYPEADNPLRAARRPKPLSLKEQALNGLQRIEANIPQSLKDFESSCEVIRRAIEALPND